MNRPLFYRLDGHTPEPCEAGEWASRIERGSWDDDLWRVDRTPLFDGVYVSTVFLGLDHQWGDGPPLLFETMVFGWTSSAWCLRCSTWEQAEAQHARAVAEIEEVVRRDLEAKRGQA